MLHSPLSGVLLFPVHFRSGEVTRLERDDGLALPPCPPCAVHQ